MPPVPDDVVRVQLVHDTPAGDEVFLTTFHVLRDHGTGNVVDWPVDLSLFAAAVRDAYVGPGRPLTLMPTNVNLREVVCYKLNPADGKAQHKGAAFHGQSGGAASAPLPYDVACTITLLTDKAGEVLQNPKQGPNPSRRARGRMYFGPLPVSSMGSNGRFNTGFRDSVANAFDDFFEFVEGAGLGAVVGGGQDSARLVVLSRAGVATRRVTGIRVDDLPDTQRRRSNRQKPARTFRPLTAA